MKKTYITDAEQRRQNTGGHPDHAPNQAGPGAVSPRGTQPVGTRLCLAPAALRKMPEENKTEELRNT